MVTYGEIGEFIKKKDTTVKNVYVHDLHTFVVEERVTKKGRYKITLSFNSKEMLKNVDSIPRSPKDFILRPLLILMEQDWNKINTQNPKKTEKEDDR